MAFATLRQVLAHEKDGNTLFRIFTPAEPREILEQLSAQLVCGVCIEGIGGLAEARGWGTS